MILEWESVVSFLTGFWAKPQTLTILVDFWWNWIFIIIWCYKHVLMAQRLISASGWGSGDPRFQSDPRLSFQSCSRCQQSINQAINWGSKAASESTFETETLIDSRILAGYQMLDFEIFHLPPTLHYWINKLFQIYVNFRSGPRRGWKAPSPPVRGYATDKTMPSLPYYNI